MVSSAVVGFICNVVHPLFTEWHRLLLSPLSLLLLDNLQSNLRRWQSVSTDNVSLLTVADSSDDSTPSNADQGDRHLLSVSGDLGASKPHVAGGGSGDGGSQTESVFRRASMPPLSATSVAGVTVRRGSSPVVGAQHVSCRRVCLLSSLAEDTAPAIALPSPPGSDASNELDVSLLPTSYGLNCVCRNGHCKDVILTDSVCLTDAQARHCSVHANGKFQVTSGAADFAPVIYASDGSGSNGALPNGVVSGYKAVRRGSAPVACSARPPVVSTARRGSAPSPGADLIAVSLWTSKRRPFSTDATPGRRPSLVVVESPHFTVDQLSVVCVLTNSSTLKLPLLEHSHGGRCRERRSHSAHAVVINPAATECVERRRSSSPVTFSTVGTSAT